jgi:hypothetical protein
MVLRFIHKYSYNQHYYYADCQKSKALLKVFGVESIIGELPMKVLGEAIDVEIIEFPHKKENDPFKHRRRNR